MEMMESAGQYIRQALQTRTLKLKEIAEVKIAGLTVELLYGIFGGLLCFAGSSNVYHTLVKRLKHGLLKDYDSNCPNCGSDGEVIASFMVVGDWGHDPISHGNLGTDHCQKLIAQQMHLEFKRLNKMAFILNVRCNAVFRL